MAVAPSPLVARLRGAAPVRSPDGHAQSLAATEAWLAPRLARVPISRVYDATPLDRLGLPVWAAVTPLAADLTVHAGKGVTHAAARLSAIMEAIERVSAERVPSAFRADLHGARARHGAAALDPALFDLPFQTAHEAARPCGWVGGHDLLAGCAVWVARDLVISPPRDGVTVGVETNGLAAGTLHVEAALHALYEVIERDALATDLVTRELGDPDAVPPRRLIALDTLPATAARWVARLRRAGLSVSVEELTHDIGVPVFRVRLTDLRFPGREGRATAFDGCGADLDAGAAITRAVCEAVQSHTAVLVGARDAFEGGRRPGPGLDRLIACLSAGATVQPFVPTPAARLPADLGGRLELVRRRLHGAGFAHCVVVDLTRPDLGVPVVRVLLAGAAGPYGETARRPPPRLLRGLL